MSVRATAVIVVLLGGAVPVTAQYRGTLEFGAFASNTSFGSELGLNNSWGAGGRVGVFVVPRVSLEFEGGGSRAGRSLGLQDVNVGVLSARVTAIPLTLGRLSLLLGGGVDHTDMYFVESYGVHWLVGAKLRLTESVALRIDGIASYLANGDHANRVLHAGLSIYRHPSSRGTTLPQPVSPIARLPDSVSANEMLRLRSDADSYQRLRDSLTKVDHSAAVLVSAPAIATMHEMIYFHNDRSDLSDSAKATLRDKVTVFRSHPAMRIVIVGFTSQPGTKAYNMALGLRRAEAARAYLVSQGINPALIEIGTLGAGELVVEGPGEAADAANRRGQFRLVVAEPSPVPKE